MENQNIENENPENPVFKAISRRRVSNSMIIQQLWDAIQNITHQRQQPNVDRIARYMSRVHGVAEDEVLKQLTHGIRDGLLKHFKRMGFKGSKIGVEQEGYQVPPVLQEVDGHDWYCFECHSSGDVICCTTCHRVYHLACIPDTELPEEDPKQNFSCAICKVVAEEKEKNLTPRKLLNQLLIFTCARLAPRLPKSLVERQVPSKGSLSSDSGTWVLDDEQTWRAEFLIYNFLDIPAMEAKAHANKYACLKEFEADTATILHNVIIYHGADDPLAECARQMLNDCLYDLNEVRQCQDCYRRSNEKHSKNWFCQPCSPPHTLVYAKQKGYPFWPAKVIKEEGGMFDVRFFGEPHERAKLEESAIRPITADLSKLGVKRTASWVKAYDELRKHQQLLSKGTSDAPELSAGEDEPSRKKFKKSPGRKKSLKPEVKKELNDESGQDQKPELEQQAKAPGRKSVSGGQSEQKELKPEVKTPGRPSGKVKVEKQVKSEPKKRGRKPVKSMKSDASGDESSTSFSSSSGKEVGEEAIVSSSWTEPKYRNVAVQTSSTQTKTPEPSASAKKQAKEAKEAELKMALDKLRRELEKDKAQALAQVVRNHERDIERLKAEHKEQLIRLNEEHAAVLEDAKRKQWCYNCDQEAIYHCCWNTAYCSTECQQSHWHSEHKRQCRRKR